jgi:hypothetical protein
LECNKKRSFDYFSEKILLSILSKITCVGFIILYIIFCSKLNNFSQLFLGIGIHFLLGFLTIFILYLDKSIEMKDFSDKDNIYGFLLIICSGPWLLLLIILGIIWKKSNGPQVNSGGKLL